MLLLSVEFSVFGPARSPKRGRGSCSPLHWHLRFGSGEGEKKGDLVDLFDSCFNSCWWVYFPKPFLIHPLFQCEFQVFSTPNFNQFWCCHPSHKCRHTPTPSSRPRDGNCLNSRVSSRNSRTMTRESTEASGPVTKNDSIDALEFDILTLKNHGASWYRATWDKIIKKIYLDHTRKRQYFWQPVIWCRGSVSVDPFFILCWIDS